MTIFNLGDRVRLSANADIDRRNGNSYHDGLGDAEGTVRSLYPGARVVVDWDGHDSYWNNPRVDEIELVPAATLEPTDPDLTELRERLLDKAIKVADYNPSPESVLAFARAFESYILGDTK